MTIRNTILSQKDHYLLENLLAKHGDVVQFEQIVQEAKHYTSNRQSVRNWVNKLTQTGWLVRLQRGTYVISSMESLGAITLASPTVAQIIVPQSYVSFEAALQHHGMFDQMLKIIRSVSLKKETVKVIQDIQYHFVYTTQEQYYGFIEEKLDNRIVKIATAEKALLDLLHFHRSLYAVDIVQEKFREYKSDIDLQRLIELLRRQTVTVQRIVGFVLDQIQYDTSQLYILIQTDRSVSKMTTDSTKFSAKWRLYYHQHFEQ
ncbi:MAG: type IV toxin-antitoxin system AbiEi family antitoxin domain-containing protein [Patescibacteria group bacterium]|jgi:predicted transcriptional regulator of viral defense system